MIEFKVGDRVRLNDAHPIFEQYVSNLIEAEVVCVDKHNFRLENISSKPGINNKLLYLDEGEESSYDFYPNQLSKTDIRTISGLILHNEGTYYSLSNFDVLREEEFEKHKHLIGLPILIPASHTNQKNTNKLLKQLPIL